MSSAQRLTLVFVLAALHVLAGPLCAAPATLPRADQPVPGLAPADGALVQGTNGTLLVPGLLARTLPVQVTNVQLLGAVTVLVTYDAALVRPTACQLNFSNVGPDPNMRFNFGLCNPANDEDGDGIADSVRFNLVSILGVSTGATPWGLANITWQAVAGVRPPASSDLIVEILTFTNPTGVGLDVAKQDGSLTLEAGPAPVHLPLLIRGASGGLAALAP